MAAGIMILTPKRAGRQAVNTRLVTFVSWLSTFLVGIYAGYFGAASGLLMIAVLSKIVHENYAIYNSMRNFASFCNNIVAAIMFICTIPIDWRVIIPLLIGLFTGGILAQSSWDIFHPQSLSGQWGYLLLSWPLCWGIRLICNYLWNDWTEKRLTISFSLMINLFILRNHFQLSLPKRLQHLA